MLKVKDVKKRYGDFELNLSMKVPEGQVTGLVGKNGSGKTTLIKLILGLVKSENGDIIVCGKRLTDITVFDKEKIGVAFADSGFSGELNLRDVSSILKSMYRKFNENRFLEKCRFFKLPFDKKIREFSTGMKARLRVLVAMSHKAELLILDEPTAGMDVEARNEILDLLRDYVAEDEKRSLLITSHISSDLEGLCDDIYLIDNGRILLHEDTDVILGKYGVLKVDEETYDKIDRTYIISSVRKNYGYICLTDEKQYYVDNYPKIVIENSGIDDIILLMTGGER